MKFLILILSLFIALTAFGQTDRGALNKNTRGKLLVHKLNGFNWEEEYRNQYDSTEIIRNMLIGKWQDTSFQQQGFKGSETVELEVHSDSIIETSKWRTSKYYYPMIIFDSSYFKKLKNDLKDSTLHISKAKYKWKLMYKDWGTSRGYCIEVPSEDTINMNSTNMDDFSESIINSISSKYLIIGGMWCPCVTKPTEIYKKEY